MKRKSGRPEQLRLEFDWGYINRLIEASEQADYFEAVSRAAGSVKSHLSEDPILKAIGRMV